MPDASKTKVSYIRCVTTSSSYFETLTHMIMQAWNMLTTSPTTKNNAYELLNCSK